MDNISTVATNGASTLFLVILNQNNFQIILKILFFSPKYVIK